MSDGVHLLVPFASSGAPAARELLESLELPHLRRLLRRLAPESTDAGDPRSLCAPHERVLARSWGLEPVDGLIPFAALQAHQSGQEPGTEGWAWITPCHWRVGRDHVDMAHPQDLQLDAEDSQALLALMQPYFTEDGITLAYDAPLRWLARGAIFRTLPSASPKAAGEQVAKGTSKWTPSDTAILSGMPQCPPMETAH